jgi:hypothetical protein
MDYGLAVPILTLDDLILSELASMVLKAVDLLFVA